MAFDSTIFAAFVGVAGIAFAAGCGPSHEEKLQTELMVLQQLERVADEVEAEHREWTERAKTASSVSEANLSRKVASQHFQRSLQHQAEVDRQRMKVRQLRNSRK